MDSIFDPVFTLDPAAHLETRPDGLWLDAPHLDVLEMARRMAAAEALLSTISATALPDGETELIYHYRSGSAALNIRVCTTANSIPSIAPLCQAANWIEREIQDLYAVKFTGHPNPARLIRPPQLPEGFFRQPGGRSSRK
jgi:NADH-quinone oxidoreductase subunit C